MTSERKSFLTLSLVALATAVFGLIAYRPHDLYFFGDHLGHSLRIP